MHETLKASFETVQGTSAPAPTPGLEMAMARTGTIFASHNVRLSGVQYPKLGACRARCVCVGGWVGGRVCVWVCVGV